MRLLLDNDVTRYQIGSIQMAHPFLAGEKIPAHPDYIRHCVDDLIERAIKVCKADSFLCVLSGKGNFRHEVAKQAPYKGNRADASKPFHYKTVEQHIIDNYPHIIIDDIEADDYLGIELRKDPHNTIVGTRDKDIDGVEGWHYRWACGENQPERLPRFITREEALHFFFYQMLIGDSTDNIVGCGVKKWVKWGKVEQTNLDGSVSIVPQMMMRRKGIGEKAAQKLLQGVSDNIEAMYNIVLENYKTIFPETWEEVMLENARLLYIGQEADNLFQWDMIPETQIKEDKHD